MDGRSSRGRQTWLEAKHPVEPTFLLGRKVLVKQDGYWYSGTVEKYDAEILQHKVVNETGGEEWLFVGSVATVKISCTGKEYLPLPSAEQIEQLATILLQQADQDEAAATTAETRRKKLAAAERKRSKSQQLLQLAEDTASAPAADPVQAAEEPVQAAIVPTPADQGHPTPPTAQQHAEDAATVVPAADLQPAGTGGLSEALLVAAQQLLQKLHPANVPGLGFSKVEWPWQKIGPNMTALEAQRQLDSQRQQQQQQKQQDAGVGSDLLCLDQELAAACEQHQMSKQEHMQHFKELDVALRVTPEGLVGRDVRVYWPLDDAWFLGTVDCYDPTTAQHKVSYADGTDGDYWLGTERVRVQHHPGEQLPAPDADTLHQLAQKYLDRAELLQQKQHQQRHQKGGPAAAGTTAPAEDEDPERPSLLQSKAQLLLAAAHIKQQGMVPDVWQPAAIRLKAASSSGPDAKSVKAGVGGGVATIPGAFGGSNTAAPGTGQANTLSAAAVLASVFAGQPPPVHQQQPLQQDQQPVDQQQQISLKRSASAAAGDSVLKSQSAEDVHAAKRRKGLATRQGDTAVQQVEAGTTASEPAVLQEVQQPQQQLLGAGCSGSGKGLTIKAFRRKDSSQQRTQTREAAAHDSQQKRAAHAAAQSSQDLTKKQQDQQEIAAPQLKQAASVSARQGPAGTSSAQRSVVFSVLPGDVVWVQSKGNPTWPAVVISSEEATDWSVLHRFPKQLQLCVQYFGEYARARVHPSSLVPPCVALEQRVWIPMLLSKIKQKLLDAYRLALGELVQYCKTGQLPDPEMVPEHNDDRWFTADDTSASMREALGPDKLMPSSNSGRTDLAAEPNSSAAAAAISAQASGQQKVSRIEKSLCIKLNKLGSSAGTSASSAAEDQTLKELRGWATELVASTAGKSSPAAAGATSSGFKANKAAKLPLQISSNLILLSVGRVEFLHPCFHTEKFIYPVGFSVRRKARSPASNGSDLWHLCEIQEQPDGSGPLFRVTPEGGKPVSGNSPSAAWEQLYKGSAAGGGESPVVPSAAARAGAGCGPKLFSLQHAVIRALIQALPNAAACDKFIAWQGERPAPVKLTAEQRLAKRAIATKLLSLPPGIAPRPLTRRMVSACDACGDEYEIEGNYFVECDKCRVVVHMRCYGLSQTPDGRSWLCDVCRLPGLSCPPPCTLCPRLGGAMKVTADGGWCHLMCATWVPGMCVADAHKMEPIMGRVHKDHRSLLCSICKQPYGACIQCAGSSKCYAAFHPSCARDAGYAMVAVPDEDSDSEPESGAAAEGAAAACADAVGVGNLQQQVSSKSRAPKQHRRPKKVRKEGTSAGDNTRLFCFCPKHRHKAAGHERYCLFETSVTHAPVTAAGAGAAGTEQVLSRTGGSLRAADGGGRTGPAAAAAMAAVEGGQNVASPRSAAAASGPFANAAVAAKAAPQACGAGTCARSRPADTAVRRGLRAPDALAAALRKRQYVRPLPYIVSSCTQAMHVLPPPVSRSRTTGPEFEWYHTRQQQQGQPQQQGHQSGQQQGSCQQLSSRQSQQHEQSVAQATSNAPLAASQAATAAGPAKQQTLVLQQQARAAVAGSFPESSSSWGISRSSNGSLHMSLADRYQLMTATVRQRVTCGKSSIHGLGVFAKVLHKAGDMIVEYVGHLVRPRVADILEARTYNQLVGAGTYVFRLNDSYLVDATRAGNIAHLINHSCAPCCVSKTYTIQDPHTGEKKDHVVIVAKRDITVGEELSYDYRFAGDERLRCNCGAVTCRGWVNNPSRFDSPMKPSDGSLLVPVNEVVPVKRGVRVGAPAIAHRLFQRGS